MNKLAPPLAAGALVLLLVVALMVYSKQEAEPPEPPTPARPALIDADRVPRAATPPRADGLRRVFDHRQTVDGGDPRDGFHVGALSEQVRHHDGLGARPDRFGHRRRVHIEPAGLHVAKDGPCAQARNGAGGGEKRERDGENLVARSDLQRHERQQKGVRTRGATHGVRTSHIIPDRPLEGVDLRTQNKPLRGHDTVDGRADFSGDGGVLRLKIQQRDGCRFIHGSSVCLHPRVRH